MIEQDHCEWCEAWNAEIGEVYHLTAEGKRAPLLRANIFEPLPKEIEIKLRPQFTPTFILLDGGVEVGRIEGYPGEHFFWPMLNNLLQKLPPAASGEVPPGSTGRKSS